MQQQASYPSPKVAAIPSGAPAIAVRSDPPPAAACQRVWSLWRDRWRMCGGVPTQASVIRLAPIVRTTTDLTSYVANAGVRVPSDLRVNEGLYLMPIGVEPKYDDPRTRRGGHFGFRSTGGNDPSAAPAFAWAQWVAMADALLTGKIEDPHRVALGCSLVRKPDGFSLKMWVADAAPREHARLRAALLGLLRLRPGSVRYSPHSCILRNPGVRAAVATATATTRSRHDSTSSRDSNGMSASPNTSSVGTPRRTPSPTTLTETAAWADSLTEEEGLEMIWPEPVEEDAQQQQQRPAAETPPEMYLPVPVFTNVYYPPHLQQYQQQQQQQQHNPYYTPYPYYASPHYYHLHHYHQAPVEAPTVPQPHAPQFHAEATTDATTPTTSGTRTPESLAGSDSPAPTQLGTGFCRFVLPRSFAPLRAIIRCVDDGYPRSESEPEEEEEAFLPEESRSFDRVAVKDSDWLAEQSAGEAVQRRRASC